MTDSKTATECLREMLDARGVEWWSHGEQTRTWYKQFCVSDRITHMHIDGVVETPEQAIAATLGEQRDPIKDWLLSVCNQATQDYVAELERKLEAATLGSGECEFVIEDNMNETEGMGDVWFRCTSCDTCFDYYANDWLMKQNYCPHCGKAVKR